MKHILVQYRVKPDQAADNVALIEAVFAQLAREAPSGLRYASFRLGDGVSFVHIASVEGPANPLTALAAFQAFTARIKDRCEVPPVSQELHGIGAYHFFER
ncbi:MAG: hypothetical protein JWO36_4660 [Myxococcales bacterium]|nr:hypothetical protein [Myxococcales bacterium]